MPTATVPTKRSVALSTVASAEPTQCRRENDRQSSARQSPTSGNKAPVRMALNPRRAGAKRTAHAIPGASPQWAQRHSRQL